jgi:uncharacterized iron-regulated protein
MRQTGGDLEAAMSELQDISTRAQRLSASAEQLIAGSATGADRKLVEALTMLAHSTRNAARALAALPKGD